MSILTEEMLPFIPAVICAVVLIIAGIGFLLVRQSGKVIHAGIQRNGKLTALFKGKVPFPAFDFGIITLVYSRQHLNSDLCIASFFS